MEDYSHLPSGRCGLKFPREVRVYQKTMSPPFGEVWIEIPLLLVGLFPSIGHLPSGRCGLKLCLRYLLLLGHGHLPSGRCGLKSLN